MINTLTSFLKDHYDKELPVLLAFSGGPDSLALLHLLLEFSQVSPLKLALAHVDHGWRKESAVEAKVIVRIAEKFNLPLHQKKLDPVQITGNLESACREERFHFFASLCNDYGYQAVLLAHHADDVAETVLKRVLEGSSLPCLSALRPETLLYGVKVWRPLLSVSKAHLIAWLNGKELKGFDDHTNYDTKFLRAKFRVDIIPYLSEMFGKEIAPGLCRLSDDAGELRDYLDERINPYLKEIVKGKLGYFLDLSQNCPKSLFEMKYLIKQFCRQASFVLSRDSVDKAALFVIEKTANKSFVAGKGEASKGFYLDRGQLFIPILQLPMLPLHPIKINDHGVGKFGSWKVVMTPSNDQMKKNPTQWQTLWQEGKATVVLPRDGYELASPETLKDSSLLKRWSSQKVPAFFRQQIPVILKGGMIVHEFLTGKEYASNKGYLDDSIQLDIFL